MGSGLADRLKDEVPDWVAEGIIDEGQAQRILERYETGSIGEEASRARTLLYATAAVLLGAAGIALVFVGLDPDPVQPWLAATAVGFVAAGVGLHALRPERDLLVDALLAAALAPLAVATFEPTVANATTVAYGVPTLALAVAYLGWRREQPFLPTLAVVGFTAASGGTMFNAVDAEATAALAWLVTQLGLLGLVLGLDRFTLDGEETTPVALATVAVAGSLIPFLVETVGAEQAETVQLVIGAVMVVALGAGLWLEHRGLLAGAAVALGIDAIAFSFTVGGVWLGTGVLVALAAALIWQAERLQGWMPAET
jgi:uncharacterized membrane protein YidH (DUF202 family)